MNNGNEVSKSYVLLSMKSSVFWSECSVKCYRIQESKSTLVSILIGYGSFPHDTSMLPSSQELTCRSEQW